MRESTPLKGKFNPRNTWHLYYTLIKNPELIQHRKVAPPGDKTENLDEDMTDQKIHVKIRRKLDHLEKELQRLGNKDKRKTVHCQVPEDLQDDIYQTDSLKRKLHKHNKINPLSDGIDRTVEQNCKAYDGIIDHSSKHKDGTIDQASKHKDGTIDQASKHKDGTIDQSKHKDGTIDQASKHKDGTIDQASKHKDGTIDRSKHKDGTIDQASKHKDGTIDQASKHKDGTIDQTFKAKDGNIDETSKADIGPSKECSNNHLYNNEETIDKIDNNFVFIVENTSL